MFTNDWFDEQDTQHVNVDNNNEMWIVISKLPAIGNSQLALYQNVKDGTFRTVTILNDSEDRA